MNPKKHIFISYKSEQRDLAYIVRDQLNEWGFTTWLDVDKLQPGDYWANEINQALKGCWACVAIVTPMSLASRYVTNEWDMAIMTSKLFIPLMFERTEPHYKYIDIQYIDFTPKDKQAAFKHLNARLTQPKTDQPAAPADPYHDYLTELYERINKYLSQKLISSLRDEQNQPAPISLTFEETDDVVDVLFARREAIDPLFVIGGVTDRAAPRLADFHEAFDHFDGRMLLLGEPGAGKTITLLHYARDAVVKRRQDPAAPLPILGIVPSWNPEITVTDWLAQTFGAPTKAAKLIRDGKALLLLDGLDELGSERPVDPKDPRGPKFDPRQRFADQIPTKNRVLVTCRTADYQQMGHKLHLNGALTLRPLSKEQIRHYLRHQKELFEFIESDPKLREWLDTPLLLSLFAFAFEGMNAEERAQLKGVTTTSNELRDKIFSYYCRERYQHEARKLALRQQPMPLEYDEFLEHLGLIAVKNIVSFSKYDIEAFTNILQPMRVNAGGPFKTAYYVNDGERAITPIPEDNAPALHLATHLDLVLPDGDISRFVHLLVRNFFAFSYAMAYLTRTLQLTLKEMYQHDRDMIAAVVVLGELRDLRARPILEKAATHNIPIEYGYREGTRLDWEAKSALRKIDGK